LVSLPTPGTCLFPERLNGWDSSPQTLTGEDAEFDLGNIQPASVLWGVVDLQPV